MATLQRPTLLLLDAGNTIVYLDHGRLSELARAVGASVSTDALSAGELLAKRRYETLMNQGVSHEQGWDLYMQVLFESAGLSAQDARNALEVARAEHDVFNLWRKVPDGLREALDRARKAGLRLGVVSNSEGKLRALFDRLDLTKHFEIIVDSALEGVRKPDPEIFHRALTRLQVPASQALYAGDIPNVDVVGARAAGMEGVLIDTLGHFADYRDAPRFATVVELLAAMGI